MLAKRRSLALDGVEIERTPLLVPSFSSKGFPEVADIVEYSSELIEGPVLISAYDLHYKEIAPPFDFSSLIFLDSGGYEASKEADLSDFGDRRHSPKGWSRKPHEAVIRGWKSRVPTVLISYDHPRERLSVAEQVLRARALAPNRKDLVREILLKPETEIQTRLNMKNVINNVCSLTGFDVIGVTEKEIGLSVLDRMKNIASLRMALWDVGLDTPIHVFGSLDTVTTPLYFLSGADIFDGLTWLRFAYRGGMTLYKQNFGAMEGIDIKAHVLDGVCWNRNYRYLQVLQSEMRRFLKTGDFTTFKFNGDLFRDALDSAVEAVGAADGR
jgi:hypothetical protein